VLADGTVIEGMASAPTGEAVGEVCFNTAMTGYQEILTDPSYAGQIVTFTFPHIGNVGVNDEDIETVNMAAASGVRGVCPSSPTSPSPPTTARRRHLDAWLKRRGIVGIAGIDTRALTALIREKGMPNAVIAHARRRLRPRPACWRDAKAWPGLVGMDLARRTSPPASATPGTRPPGSGARATAGRTPEAPRRRVDYGVKRNILRLLADHGCRVTVVPATATADDILA
jgi:carbamoyl-phosphate synthase small subunit